MKNIIPVPPLTVGEVTVHIGDVSTIHEVGEWYKFLDERDVRYISRYDLDYEYRYDYIVVLEAGVLVGYAIGIDKNVLNDRGVFSKYDRVYDLLDVGIDCEPRCEQLADVLFEYVHNLARARGCTRIKADCTIDEFQHFYSYLVDRAGMQRVGDTIFCEVADPLEYPCMKHLRATPTDALSTENLYYLAELGFDIGDDICSISTQIGHISIDRGSGIISYPPPITDEGKSYAYQIDDLMDLSYIIDLDSIPDGYAESIILHKSIDIQGRNYTLPLLVGDRVINHSTTSTSQLMREYDILAQEIYHRGLAKTMTFHRAEFDMETWSIMSKYSYIPLKVIVESQLKYRAQD
ncbi:MAG: hypothetical protein IKD20_06090 [Clostridia bacterium]|nr:hypothetical protein [Clostridia bacterium]